MRGLTRQQRVVLAFVRKHLREKGVSPTLREIAWHLGAVSTGAAADHVKRLEEKGYVRRLQRRGRGLVLAQTPKPRAERRERIAQIREHIAALEEELATLLGEDG